MLAHELGHWKHRDPLKLLVLANLQIALTFGVFAGFIGNVSLFRSFGFNVSSTAGYLPIIIGLELFQLVLSPTDALLKFGINASVRSMEYGADEFAAGLTRPAFTEEQVESLMEESKKGPSSKKASDAASDEKSKGGDHLPDDPEAKLQLELSQMERRYDELLAKALIKLHIQNLSSMWYDPLYSAYHHSHPSLSERLTALERRRASLSGVDNKKKEL